MPVHSAPQSKALRGVVCSVDDNKSLIPVSKSTVRDAVQNKLGVTQTPTLLGQETAMNSPILAPWDIST